MVAASREVAGFSKIDREKRLDKLYLALVGGRVREPDSCLWT
ncbi:MAG: hypothetical protein ABRQ39_24465 [Candidatus Eremiobacterota bacterium]